MHHTIDIPALVKQKVLEIDPKAQVILYGSRARGDHRPDSDWDFLVILSDSLNDTNLKSKVHNLLFELEMQYEILLNVLVHKQYSWKKNQESLLYKEIQKDGIAA